MSIHTKAWSMIKWKFMKRRLGYDQREMRQFRADPRNGEILSKAPGIINKRIIAEVIASHGCKSRHGIGDKFYFDGFGNLLTDLGPGKICIYALDAITPQIFCANELLNAGVDPNTMKFKRAACFDVGLECGGWGRVVMEISVVDD